MMTNDTKRTETILRDLIASFTTHPEAVQIDAQLAPGSAYWMVKGHPEDEPILVGKQGSHVRALAFLVYSFGAARKEHHTFRLITEQAPRVRPPMQQLAAMRHKPEPARLLLVRLLEELYIGSFRVEVGPGTGPRSALTFVFAITVQDSRDYNALTVSAAEPRTDETIIGALGTLFRAIAKKNGVRYELAISLP